MPPAVPSCRCAARGSRNGSRPRAPQRAATGQPAHKTGRRAGRLAAVRGMAPGAKGFCGRVGEYWVAGKTLVSYLPSLQAGQQKQRLSGAAGSYRGEDSKR